MDDHSIGDADGYDYERLNSLLPRYMRVDAGHAAAVTSSHSVLQKVNWLPGFYAMPGNEPLSVLSNQLGDYKEQGIFPMDAASAVGVAALRLSDIEDSAKVLDLCCCPGSKLLLISDMLQPQSTVIGVDISQERLYVCRSLVESWRSRLQSSTATARVIVFRADGRSFDKANRGHLTIDSEFLGKETSSGRSHKVVRNKSGRVREAKALAALDLLFDQVITDAQLTYSLESFDRVLVDAECTHDASYRHMRYSGQSKKWPQLDAAGTSTSACSQLALSHNIIHIDTLNDNKRQLMELQRALLSNGFRLLAEQGVLVYSTCSHDPAQNERIVQWLLEQEPTAQLDPIEATPADSPDAAALQEIKSIISSCSLLSAAEVIAEEGGAEGEEGGAEGEQLARKRRRYDNSDDAVASARLCKLVSELRSAPVQASPLLPGAVHTGCQLGMSGHFIARIRKVTAQDDVGI